MRVVRDVVRGGRQQTIGPQSYPPRPQRAHVQPDGRRTRAAVEGKSQWTFFRILSVQCVGHEKHLAFDLAIAALERQPACGGGVLEYFAVERNLVMGHHRRNFGDIKFFFVLVSTRFGSRWLLLFGRIGFRGLLSRLLLLIPCGWLCVLRLLSLDFVGG